MAARNACVSSVAENCFCQQSVARVGQCQLGEIAHAGPPSPACGERVVAEPCLRHEVRGRSLLRRMWPPLTLTLSRRAESAPSARCRERHGDREWHDPSSLHHLRHDEEMLLARRRVGDDSSAMPPSVTSSCALLQGHGDHARHGLDAGTFHLVELLDPVEDAGNLLLQRLGFLSVTLMRASRAMRRTVASSTCMARPVPSMLRIVLHS